MWPFKKTCQHYWIITHTEVKTNTPGFYWQDTTVIARVCNRCLKQETHTVIGHIDKGKANLIFGESR